MEKQKCPEIRFGGFEGEWEEKAICDLFIVTRGNVLAATKTSPVPTTEKRYPVYSSQTKNNGLMGFYDKYLFENAITWTTDGANAGTVNFREGKFYSTNVNGVLLSDDGYANKAVAEILNKEAWRHVSHIGNPKLMNNVMSAIKITIPNSAEEQIAIGNFFQQLDQSIVLQQQKYTQTQNLKKAMLEKMFPKAGSKQPEIRIKGVGGDWESFRIFDIAQNKKLNNGAFNDQAKVGKGYKLINVLDMYIESDINEDNLSLLDLERKEFELNKVKYGDVFFTRSSLVKEGIAFSNVYLGQSNDITYDGHLIKLSPNFELVNPIFLNYCLKTSKIRTQLILGGKSTTMTTIGQQEVGNTTVDIPTLEEQTAIGQFFKQLDDTLALQQQQLQTLKNLKQAFLAKMFV